MLRLGWKATTVCPSGPWFLLLRSTAHVACTVPLPSSPPLLPRVCPIFQVSNVTGENLGLLKSFVNLLTARMPPNCDKPAEFQIDETYYVPVSC